MEPTARVEWLRDVTALLDRQQAAMIRQDVPAFLAVTEQLEALLQQHPRLLDSPPAPLERAFLRSLGRSGRSTRRLLTTLTEPLRELDEVARRHDLSVALDCQA